MSDLFLILRAGAVRLGLPLAAVREVLPLLPVEAVPGLPRPLLGFVDLRGDIVAVVQPLALLDPQAPLPPVALSAHLVRLRGDDAPCLLVDRAEDAVQGAPQPIDPAHSLHGTVTGELPLGEGTALVIDSAALLLAAERAAIARLATAAAARRDQWAAA
ncbi:chemotaxis protein CheW [Sphingomonas sp. VNH70]|uniref:chemotaxis protein CheW n=1 Tax=Sphingomonas silueang TaxID=3156617 RepID=UPI0032B54752